MFNTAVCAARLRLIQCKQNVLLLFRLIDVELLRSLFAGAVVFPPEHTVSVSNPKKQFIFSYHPMRVQITYSTPNAYSFKYIAERCQLIDSNQKIIGKLLYVKYVMLHVMRITGYFLGEILHLFDFCRKFTRIFAAS